MTSNTIDPQPALIALSEAATPGEWRLGALGPPEWRYLWSGNHIVAAVSEWTESGELVGNIGGLSDADARANAEFICALVNHFRTPQSRPEAELPELPECFSPAQGTDVNDVWVKCYASLCRAVNAEGYIMESANGVITIRKEATTEPDKLNSQSIAGGVSDDVVQRAWDAYSACTEKLDADECGSLMDRMRHGMRAALQAAYGQQCAATRPTEVGGAVRASDLELIVAQMREEGSRAFDYYAQRISNLCTPAPGSEPDALQHKHEMGPPKSDSEVKS